MKYVRYEFGGKASYGILEGETVHETKGSVYEGATRTGETHPLKSVKLLAPVEPSKIIAIGLNYSLHAAEAGRELPEEPVMFMKPPTSIIAPEEPIILPSTTRRTDHEAELVVVMGKKCRNVSREEALKYVFGYTCGNDVSDRVIQRKDGQWVRAKAFDTFCPLGPWVETDLDTSAIDVKAVLNGEVKQNSNTKYLIFDVPFLVEFVSRCMTLLPGDIIMTGTPNGVSPMKHGDTIEIVIQGIGTLTNPVVYNGPAMTEPSVKHEDQSFKL